MGGGDGLQPAGRRAERDHASSVVGHPCQGVCDASEHTVGLWNLAGWTLLERGLRISMVGLGAWFLSKLLHPWLRRFYGVYLSIVTVLFTAALSAVIPRGPSRRQPDSNRCRGGHDADDDKTRLVKCLESQHDT